MSVAGDQVPHWEETHLGDATVGLAVLGLAFSMTSWIHRRSHHAEIVTATHYRRRATVDFTVPNEAPAVAWAGGSSTVRLVVIEILQKGALPAFDLRDEDGRALPLLTRRQNGLVAAAGLVAMAETLLGVPPGGLDASVADLLRTAACESPEEAAIALTQLASLANPQPLALMNDPGFSSVLYTLSNNFLLVCPLDCAAGDRRIIKLAFEQGAAVPAKGTWRGLPEALGWRPQALRFEANSAGDSESFHFEVIAPEGSSLVDAALGDVSRVGLDGKVDPAWIRSSERVLTTSPHRAHVYASRIAATPSDPDLLDMADPMVVVRLQIEREGWVRAACIASVFVVIFMLASWGTVIDWADGRGQTDQAFDCDVETQGAGQAPRVEARCSAIDPVDEVSTDPAALMVALLGFITLAVVRPGEHAYTASLVRPLRWASLGTAIPPLAGAWLIAFSGGETLRVGWGLLSAGAVFLMVVLAGAYWRLGSGDV